MPNKCKAIRYCSSIVIDYHVLLTLIQLVSVIFIRIQHCQIPKIPSINVKQRITFHNLFSLQKQLPYFLIA